MNHAGKIQTIAVNALEQLSQSKNWIRYVSQLGKLYRYPFKSSLLIFTQSKNINAFATYSQWNGLGRRVRRGEHGVNILIELNGSQSVQTVFDISQTSGDDAYIWEYDSAHEKYFVDLFSSEYGLPGNMDFQYSLVNAACKISRRNIAKFINMLEKKDDEKFASIFEDMVDLSVQQATLVRCGFDGFNHELFKHLRNFSKNELVVLGNAVTQFTREVLSPIERKMKDENRRNTKEKNHARYDQAGAQERLHARGSGRTSDNAQRSDQRSRADARGIHRDGHRGERLSPEGDGSIGAQYRQIRFDEIETSEGIQAGHVRPDDIGRDAAGALHGDRSIPPRHDQHTTQEVGAPEGKPAGVREPVQDARKRASEGTGLHRITQQIQAESEQLSAFLMPQTDVDQILRTGSNDDNSLLRITVQFSKGKGAKENITFLKREYRGGKGLYVNGEKISVWFDEAGIHIANGETVIYAPAKQHISWEQAEQRIGELLEQGQYITRDAFATVSRYERTQLAETLWHLHQDLSDDARGSYFDDEIFKGGFPESTARIAELLHLPESRAAITSELERFVTAYEQDHALLRFRYHKPQELLNGMRELQLPRHKYTSNLTSVESLKMFITQDEVDTALISGSSFSGGKTRIYAFFTQPHTSKEKADFLQKEYGTGGRSHALSGASNSWEDHSSKGLEYRRGPEDDLLRLRWSAVAKRIDFLIENDRYLTTEEKERFLEQQREKEQSPAIPVSKDDEIDVDPIALRERLKQSGIENGQLVDPEKLDKDPFIQQVMADAKRATHSEKEQPHNFHITDEHLGAGGAKTKYAQNVAAIRTLKLIEIENRTATAEEQQILARYVGWGGIAQAFDAGNASWAKEYADLRQLLTDSEYSSARESTLNAHYTSPTVIKAMYTAIKNTGIKSGNMLEPSCGVGNFLGLLPQSMDNIKLHGVELDSISGRIAQQLYQNADIKVQGFETTTYQNDYFDFAIGNVPFGDYHVHDPQFNKYKFNIHDYFVAKMLDKVKPGGIIAYITSKGTMDKANNSARKYIAQRAELIGAIRLPNTAFYKNAGTQVTTDILFLQKRDRITDVEPEWIHIDKTADGIKVNSYYTAHPYMMLGRMVEDDGMYGHKDTACVPFEGADLAQQLYNAIRNIRFDADRLLRQELVITTEKVIPADPSVKRYSYTLVNDVLYFREDTQMLLVETNEKQAERAKGLIEVRECLRSVIDAQVNDLPLEEIKQAQSVLNERYDDFVDSHGRINSDQNARAFSRDDSYLLLCSIEKFDDDGKFVGKADIFDKLTVRPSREITHADTAIEAYGISMSRKCQIDIDYMSELTGKQPQELIESLQGVIYKNPVTGAFESADEYLSGKVKLKLAQARDAGEKYAVNVAALEKVQPKRLEAMDIDVKLGTIWVPENDYTAFMHELFGTFWYNREAIVVHYSPITGEWNISNKGRESDSVAAGQTYGTSRKSAYHILENALNQRPTKVYDTYDDNGKRVSVLNKRETMLASQKQVLIEQKFKDWIYKDQERRERLVNFYNDHFNNIRPREYDGSHIEFIGMSPEIRLKEHQVNGVARQLYGGNALLAHCVGAGKTFTMIAAAMEGKRLGLWHKSMIVVPNHLTKQTAIETLRLYPSANILVTTKDDLTTKKRKQFCSRIATGDYDIVIIAHSQFERIPLSVERQENFISRQIDEIVEGIDQLRRVQGQEFNVKQMAKTKKRLESKLRQLNNAEKKDSVIMFEELGVDRLFVDESHEYKNLFVATKMNNVAGISSSESQKATDMFLKCQYLSECGHRITFSTGTPISNSMAEMYTNQRYLAMDALKERGLEHFDNWASCFGETKTAYEVNITAQGFKTTTRFARFTNIPELMNMVREFMDIQTDDMLDLDRPKLKNGEIRTITTKPTDIQKTFILGLNERYEKLPNDSDNALCITNDGRKVAIDQRLINPLLPDEDSSKVNALMQNVFDIYNRTRSSRDTQLVFCDVSTPKPGGAFSVYQDLKNKWIENGVPADEIAFIHDAKTDTQKEALFAKVRNGKVRILIGSTQKMGTGTNCQKKLLALHHLDVPWRPSDLEQRNGRIIRQGNDHEEVEVYRYVTEGTFDTYNYQLLEQKQRYISQIMTSKSPTRSAEDLDDMTLSYAEVKALATGNPHIRQKMELEVEVQKLRLLKSEHQSNIYMLENKISSAYPQQIERLNEQIAAYIADIETVTPFQDAEFTMVLQGVTYDDRKVAGETLLKMCSLKDQSENAFEIGCYKGLPMHLKLNPFDIRYEVSLAGRATHRIELGQDVFGNLQRIENKVQSFKDTLDDLNRQLDRTREQLRVAQQEMELPFHQDQQLTDMLIRLDEINHLLDMDKPNEHDKVVENNTDYESKLPRTKEKKELER